MAKRHIIHGDLKQINIPIADNGPTITDLDGMKVHKCKLLFKAKQAKDLERFTQRTVNCSAMEPD